MPIRSRFSLSLLIVVLLGLAVPVAAQSNNLTNSTSTKLYLPLMHTAAPSNPFGFDLSIYSGTNVLNYGLATQPRWARAGDVLWSQVEPVRGAGYDWSSVALVEANIRRLREAGVEPTLIVQQSPSWAQSVPGRMCSPPKPEYMEDFARFVEALAARYSQGELAVHYWEIWNEPDFAPGRINDSHGVGCWGNESAPDNGGIYYGQMLQRIYPAVKAGNPHAQVWAGSLASFAMDDSRNDRFLRGMLSSGRDSFDALSFHAYGEWSAGDLLLFKTNRFRSILAEYGRPNKPLVATEVAATCPTNDIATCKPNYNEWVRNQANYAARIYAEAMALDLLGAFWYSLSLENPGFAYSHILDVTDGQVTPRPAYYAFSNSSRLLAGARYVGEPLKEPTPQQMTEVQVLKFRKPHSILYVLWVPQLDFPKTPYALRVYPGSTAICTQNLERETPNTYYCNDTDKNGIIWLGVISLPQYIEVLD